MKIRFDMLKNALSAQWHHPVYLHKATGHVLFVGTGTIFEMWEKIKPEDVEEIAVPHLSQAYMRQRYFHAAFPNEEDRERVCLQYKIDDTFLPLIQDEKRSAEESAYIQRVHRLFEDHRIEEAYCVFEDAIESAYAILWCVEHGYDYEEDIQ